MPTIVLDNTFSALTVNLAAYLPTLQQIETLEDKRCKYRSQREAQMLLTGKCGNRFILTLEMFKCGD